MHKDRHIHASEHTGSLFIYFSGEFGYVDHTLTSSFGGKTWMK